MHTLEPSSPLGIVVTNDNLAGDTHRPHVEDTLDTGRRKSGVGTGLVLFSLLPQRSVGSSERAVLPIWTAPPATTCDYGEELPPGGEVSTDQAAGSHVDDLYLDIGVWPYQGPDREAGPKLRDRNGHLRIEPKYLHRDILARPLLEPW